MGLLPIAIFLEYSFAILDPLKETSNALGSIHGEVTKLRNEIMRKDVPAYKEILEKRSHSQGTKTAVAMNLVAFAKRRAPKLQFARI